MFPQIPFEYALKISILEVFWGSAKFQGQVSILGTRQFHKEWSIWVAKPSRNSGGRVNKKPVSLPWVIWLEHIEVIKVIFAWMIPSSEDGITTYYLRIFLAKGEDVF